MENMHRIDQFTKQAQPIDDLCRTLFCSSPINAFGYIKIKDNKLVYLCSNSEWIEYFFDKNFHEHINPSTIPELFNYHYVLGDSLKDLEILTDAANNFNYAHVFTVNTRHEDEVEIFLFAAGKEIENADNWYINNLQMLHQFSVYFKSSFGFANKKFLPIQLNIEVSSPVEHESSQINIPQGHIELDGSFIIQSSGETEHLTIHEMQCLKYLFEGKTATEIAKIVNRSDRTIETHIQNIKRKLHCSRRSELIQKIIEHKLHYFFMKM